MVLQPPVGPVVRAQPTHCFPYIEFGRLAVSIVASSSRPNLGRSVNIESETTQGKLKNFQRTSLPVPPVPLLLAVAVVCQTHVACGELECYAPLARAEMGHCAQPVHVALGRHEMMGRPRRLVV